MPDVPSTHRPSISWITFTFLLRCVVLLSAALMSLLTLRKRQVTSARAHTHTHTVPDCSFWFYSMIWTICRSLPHTHTHRPLTQCGVWWAMEWEMQERGGGEVFLPFILRTSAWCMQKHTRATTNESHTHTHTHKTIAGLRVGELLVTQSPTHSANVIHSHTPTQSSTTKATEMKENLLRLSEWVCEGSTVLLLFFLFLTQTQRFLRKQRNHVLLEWLCPDIWKYQITLTWRTKNTDTYRHTLTHVHTHTQLSNLTLLILDASLALFTSPYNSHSH